LYWLAATFQLGYAAMFLVVGLAGVIVARWELENVFAVNSLLQLPQHGATVIAQYRFLKSVEFAVGLFALVYRKGVLAGAPVAFVFLTIVAAGVVARAAAWLADGRPSWPFVLFLVLEALTFVFLVLHLTVGRADA
jgi:hypothetical protein